MEDGKGYQAEIYAEGEVRISGEGGPPRPQVRTVLRTRKQVQLRAYNENGFTQWKEPPRDLLILRRSGFVLPEPATTRPEPATTRRSRRLHNRNRRLLRGGDPGICHTPSASQVETVAGAGSVAPTAAAARPKRPPTCSRRLCRRWSPCSRQSRRGRILGSSLAQFDARTLWSLRFREQARPGLNTPGEVPPTASPPADGAELPSVDLPPIEGAKEVEVPNLTNPEDVPRSQPLPGTGDQPAAPLRSSGPGRGQNQATATPPPAPTAPILPGSRRRVTNIFPRSGRKPDVTFLPVRPDGNTRHNLSGRNQHGHQDPAVRRRGHRGRDAASCGATPIPRRARRSHMVPTAS